MLQTRTWLLGLFPFRPIIRIGCRPTPAECGPDRPALQLHAGLAATRSRAKRAPAMPRLGGQSP